MEEKSIEQSKKNIYQDGNMPCYCPWCGGVLVKRVARRYYSGQIFHGCANFPRCRYIYEKEKRKYEDKKLMRRMLIGYLLILFAIGSFFFIKSTLDFNSNNNGKSYYSHSEPQVTITYNGNEYEVLYSDTERHALPSVWVTSDTTKSCLKLKVDKTSRAFQNEYWVGRVGYDPGENKFWSIVSNPTEEELQLAYFYYLSNND